VDVIANAPTSWPDAGTHRPRVSAPVRRPVVITLAAPTPYLPTLLSHPSTCPVHRATLAAHPEGFARAGVMPANGAFVLSEWVEGSHISARRNTHYWNDAATRLAGVKYLLIPDENAELARYRAGELQVTFVVPRGQYDWIKANLADQLHVAPQLTTYYYGFNLKRAPFKDQPQLRRALSLVIDRENSPLVPRRGYGWVPPGIDNYSAQSFDYRNTPMPAQSARRSACTPRRATRVSIRCAELRYNSGEVHKARARHRLHVEGGARGGRAAHAGGSSSRCCRTSIAATWRCSARAGSGTTTMPTPSRST
jgi:oligopeptide transport system substrate-binding protein